MIKKILSWFKKKPPPEEEEIELLEHDPLLEEFKKLEAEVERRSVVYWGGIQTPFKPLEGIRHFRIEQSDGSITWVDVDNLPTMYPGKELKVPELPEDEEVV